MQRRKFWSDQIRRILDVTKPIRRGKWELISIIEPGIIEISLAVHQNIGNIRIPVGHRPPTRVGVQVNACQAECRWKQSGAGYVRAGHDAVRNLLGVNCLAVQHEFGIELSRSPAIEYRHNCLSVSSQDVFEWAEVRRESNDRAHIQVAVCPAVQAVTNPWRKGI